MSTWIVSIKGYNPSMKAMDALRVLAEVTSDQWGMVTSAQALMHGITRLDLSRLAASGHLERLAHGVYKDAGAAGDEFEGIHAAWLGTEPKRTSVVRLHDRERGSSWLERRLQHSTRSVTCGRNGTTSSRPHVGRVSVPRFATVSDVSCRRTSRSFKACR